MSPLASADIIKPVKQAERGLGAAHVIVVGNEKGGAGKSTVAIHLAIALMRMGKAVGVIDLDVRQASLSRHLSNRRAWAEKRGAKLPVPAEARLPQSAERSLDAREAEEKAAFDAALSDLKARCDYIVIDAPGGDTHYARLAHARADTLITPINDSFVDFALLADVDPETFEVGRPSIYAEMVWECRKRKAMTDRKPMDWVVMRNRVSTLDAKNKRRVGKGLRALSERIGFRLAPGFSERVIYRELFPTGLTLIDLTESGSAIPFSMSHVAARQELRELLIILKLPGLDGARIPF
ncbi:MAG: division plane positioning ATPase MipZ [Oceanicaulis sp.]